MKCKNILSTLTGHARGKLKLESAQMGCQTGRGGTWRLEKLEEVTHRILGKCWCNEVLFYTTMQSKQTLPLKFICIWRHMYDSAKWVTIASIKGLSPIWCQAIILSNADVLFIGQPETNFSNTLIKIHKSILNKMHLKILSTICPGLNMSKL